MTDHASTPVRPGPIETLFRAHPRTVGETYWQHFATASRFAWTLLGAAGACAVHAVLPFLFVKTGSRSIERLHHDMVVARHRDSRHHLTTTGRD